MVQIKDLETGEWTVHGGEGLDGMPFDNTPSALAVFKGAGYEFVDEGPDVGQPLSESETKQRSFLSGLFGRRTRENPDTDSASDTDRQDSDHGREDSRPKGSIRSFARRVVSNSKAFAWGLVTGGLFGGDIVNSVQQVGSTVIKVFTRKATRLIDQEGWNQSLTNQSSNREDRNWRPSNDTRSRSSGNYRGIVPAKTDWDVPDTAPAASGIGGIVSRFNPFKWSASAKDLANQSIELSPRQSTLSSVTNTSGGWKLSTWLPKLPGVSAGGCHHGSKLLS